MMTANQVHPWFDLDKKLVGICDEITQTIKVIEYKGSKEDFQQRINRMDQII